MLQFCNSPSNLPPELIFTVGFVVPFVEVSRICDSMMRAAAARQVRTPAFKQGSDVGRHRFVVGMMIATMIATSGCITTEPAPVQVAMDPIESPMTVTCKDGGPFGGDASHKKLAATFGASNVEYQKGNPSDDIGSSGTILYPRDPRGPVFLYLER